MARFPDDFLWGAATAAYQVEGAATQDGRGASIWDTFSHAPGRTLNGDTGDVACDHFNRLDEDLALIDWLGLRAYRFSVAWPRVQPTGRGRPNGAGLAFYERLVDGLLARGVAPALTLYHWDLPQTLEDAGGWPARDTALRFADYAAAVARALGDRVGLWMTLNEPWVSAWLGYATGVHAPGRTDLRAAALAHHHLLLGHGLALEALRAELGAAATVGIALNLHPITPATDATADVEAAARVDAQQARGFLDPLFGRGYPAGAGPASEAWAEPGIVRAGDLEAIGRPIDFLGVNYYHPRLVRHAPGGELGLDAADVVPDGAELTQMGWPVEPAGLPALLRRIATDYPPLPIYITENGAAFPDTPSADGSVADPRRLAYIDGHLAALAGAIADGIDVRGYFCWSLLDNFEWAFGYSMRFGLVHVDFTTLRRTPKRSAHWYRGVIASAGARVTG
ncbi:MAG TPA: GH1 family beta-glucosidase [Candidatus Limnocylindria bacterium]|nr:GH1 family beta-glucosidase [Candidatus Limnocylindria bacterium]